METLKSDVAGIVFHDFVVKNVLHSIWYAIDYDRHCLLRWLWKRQRDIGEDVESG